MRTFLENIYYLDTTSSFVELVRYVTDGSHNHKEIADGVALLFVDRRFRSAFILAKLLVDNGYQNIFVSAALGVGGLVYDLSIEKTQGLETLATQANALPLDVQPDFFYKVTLPVMGHLLSPHLNGGLNHYSDERLLQVLEYFKAALPGFQAKFDYNAKVPPLLAQEIRQQGREKACVHLLDYPLPPADIPRRPRRTVAAVRGGVMEVFGLRLVDAMTAYGWPVEYLKIDDSVNTCHAIAKTCLEYDAEILFLDLDHVSSEFMANRKKTIEALRQGKPQLKVVGIIYDSWLRSLDILREDAAICDAIWVPDQPHHSRWQDPAFKNKRLHIPFPIAEGYIGTTDRPLVPQMLFSGSILPSGGNWPRLFWLSAAKHLNLPITRKISNITAIYGRGDGDDVLFFHGLSDATCCANFTTRFESSTYTVTCRSWEVPLCGALLVQEWTPQMHYYFTPGEHFLEFSSVAELSAISTFITENREEAEEIRRRGHAFAYDRYRNDKLIGYIDGFLHYKTLSPRTP